MNKTCIDEKWTFRRGFMDSLGAIKGSSGEVVNLPHDGMISSPVDKDAIPLYDSGYFKGEVCNYTKYINIPEEWRSRSFGLYFDGAMMNATVEVNGSKVGLQHYGYVPFYVDLTNKVTFGEENRITVHLNTSMMPNSRWYTGTGLYRGAYLLDAPKVHIIPNGIYVFTKEVTDTKAYIEAQVEVANELSETHLVQVEVYLIPENEYTLGNTDNYVTKAKRVIQVNGGAAETAKIAVNLENPMLWDIDEPNLYHVEVRAKDIGIFRTHFTANEEQTEDRADVLFGVRTITADVDRGLQINGRTVKLKGGCLHHDNGILGAVSLYEAEARKVTKLKENGFNAIRTAHNPPSAALIEACDRLGMYIFDEAFDAWGVAKRSCDYSQYFEECWDKDLTAYVKRDRTHPCVIMWSTGNEIPERGGLNNGYHTATMLAERFHELDMTRPVSNGICSYWGGLDDLRAEGRSVEQNAPDDISTYTWETWSEPFTNGLDIVGYNYMEDLYERDHEMFPERVMLGSENFPKDIGFRWPLVEKLPYVIGDFTWTAWDYIGEAGIGKALYVDKDDPWAGKMPWEIMPPDTSYFPWRTSNDADFDITGYRLAQGAYRSVVWGNRETFLYSYHPDKFGKVEKMSFWGFPAVEKRWNYEGFEGKPIELLVFSGAEEVEVFINGSSIGRKKVSTERPMPKSVRFDAEYLAGTVEAVSYTDGKEVSRAALITTGRPAGIRLNPEKKQMRADGHDVAYIGVEVIDEQGRVVPDAASELSAEIIYSEENGAETGSDIAVIAGFGTGNPVTDELYPEEKTVSYRGRAMVILRSGYKSGEIRMKVTSKDLKEASVNISVK